MATLLSIVSSFLPQPDASGIPGYNYTVDEAPSYLRTNFIHTRYRAHLSFAECLWSMFRIHNETLQIWTHFFPALNFWYLAFKYTHRCNGCRKSPRQITYKKMPIIFPLYCISFAFVFSASWFAHTFNPINEEWNKLCWKLDWLGISATIWCVQTLLSHLAFHYQNPKTEIMWNRLFFLSSAVVAIASTKGEGNTGWTMIEKALLTMLPAACTLGFIVNCALALPTKQHVNKMAENVIPPALLALLGVWIFGFEFPERQFKHVNFDLTRGHHTFHHFWSTVFAFWFLRNSLRWHDWILKQTHVKGDDRV